MSTNALACALSRRFLLSAGTAALATTGAVGAAIASPRSDPVFALIAAEHAAWDAYIASFNQEGPDTPETDARVLAANYDHVDAQWEALTTTPTTIAGFIAMLECFYTREANGEGEIGSDSCSMDEPGNRVRLLLRSIIDAGHGLATASATNAGRGAGL